MPDPKVLTPAIQEVLSWIRPDNSIKGQGFLGSLKRPDGNVMSEFSTGSPDVTGQEMDYPSMVPTLNHDELLKLLVARAGEPLQIQSVKQKAADFARQRIAQGKPVFAQPGEAQYHIFPDLQRDNVPTTGFNDAVIRPMPAHTSK